MDPYGSVSAERPCCACPVSRRPGRFRQLLADENAPDTDAARQIAEPRERPDPGELAIDRHEDNEPLAFPGTKVPGYFIRQPSFTVARMRNE